MPTSQTELKVFILSRESTCGECGETLDRRSWIILAGDRGALCLSCADLDHLEFLARGNAALTRRAKKLSPLSAVVLMWSRARKRYERQGILVQAAALEAAEAACLADADQRAARASRRARREADLDRQYVGEFASAVRRMFPSAPAGREVEIAEHACLKHSGRIGRSRDAKSLEPAAVELAVRAHVRHRETDYDLRLARSGDRFESRHETGEQVDTVLSAWRK